MRVLVAYATHFGATREIAACIAEKLAEDGLEPSLRSVEDEPSPAAFDAYVVGSAIHAGHWLNPAVRFINHNATVLAQHPVWLFSSGPLGEAADKPQPEPKEVGQFRRSSPIRDHAVFGGAFDRASLAHSSWLERSVIRFMPEGDFRDWPEIEQWARGIARELKTIEPHLSDERPPAGGRGKELQDG